MKYLVIMKPPLLLSMIVVSGLVLGCQQQLTLSKDGPLIAPKLGVADFEIQFLSNVRFNSVYETRKTDVPAYTGVVALTDTHLYFLQEGRISHATEVVLNIPHKELAGISNIEGQILLRWNGQVVILELPDSSRSGRLGERSQNFVYLLVNSGVAEFDAVKSYTMVKSSSGVSRGRGLGSYSSGRPLLPKHASPYAAGRYDLDSNTNLNSNRP